MDSCVDKMIILAHGLPDRIQFDPRVAIEAGAIFNNQIDTYSISCQINILDIQSCLCGKGYYEGDSIVDTCVAKNFVRKPQIQKVYAWTGHSSYAFGYNYSKDAGSYIEYYMVGEYIMMKTVKTDTELIFWPSYAPLQY